jgi:hypothetical protein
MLHSNQFSLSFSVWFSFSLMLKFGVLSVGGAMDPSLNASFKTSINRSRLSSNPENVDSETITNMAARTPLPTARLLLAMAIISVWCH